MQLAVSCRNGGQQFMLDTSGSALRHAASAGVYLMKSSMRKLRDLSRHELAKEAEQEKVAFELVQSGRAAVVVFSLGEAGVILATGDGCERIRSPSVPVKNKVGAGDSMIAGIVLGLAREMPLSTLAWPPGRQL